MSAQNGHITSKVILGYLLLILIAVCSVVYIYNIIEQFVGEDDPEQQIEREGLHLCDQHLVIALRKRSTRTKWCGLPQGEIKHFNRTRNQGFAEYGFLAYH